MSMQLGVQRVLQAELLIALRTAGVGDASTQVVAASKPLGKGSVSSTEWRLECVIRICD
jgi:hypothetical protein